MACRFTVTLPDDGGSAAAHEALAEVQRLETTLSRFVPTSDIARLNAAPCGAPHSGVGVLVDYEVFRLLRRVADLSAAVDGAFDPTVGPLVALWRAAAEHGPPDAETLALTRLAVGLEGLAFADDEPRVTLMRPAMSLDLGGVGKGYAVGVAADLLDDAGVADALVDGGTSSVLARGCQGGEDGWRIALADPRDPAALLGEVVLRDRALSVSGVRGNGFTWDGQFYGHVLDPRSGRPTTAALHAVVTHPCPVTAEILSTALLVGGPDLLAALPARFPEAEALLLLPDGELRCLSMVVEQTGLVRLGETHNRLGDG